MMTVRFWRDRMQALRDWSLARVLLVSVGWILLCVLTSVAWVVFQLRSALSESSGSGGLGAVSMGISELLLWIPVLPVVLFLVAWLVARRSRNLPPAA